MRRILAAAGVAALLLGGCADESPDVGFEGLPETSPRASPSPKPSPTASAEAAAAGDVDVTTTPDEITPEWVTAVVNTLLAEYGEMEAIVLASEPMDSPQLSPDQMGKLVSIFEGEYLDRREVSLRALIANVGDEREGLLPANEYGGLRFTAELVQAAEANCVVAVGRVSRARTIIGGGPAEHLTAVSLSRARTAPANPTGWRIQDVLPNTVDKQPQPDDRMLRAKLSDYGNALQHSCSGASS